MATDNIRSEWVLVLIFVFMIFAVPLSQGWLELHRENRVQATEVFQTRTTAKNLRQYESTLEEKSSLRRHARSFMQGVLYRVFGDPGSKAVRGRDGWLFYRPDLRYLIEPNRLELPRTEGKWLSKAPRKTQREHVLDAIVRFRDQLGERGIQLLVVPVPGKPGVYPDQLQRSTRSTKSTTTSPTATILEDLEARGVATVNLFSTFQEARQQAVHDRLYLAHDTHWTPAGAQLAASAAATRLLALNWVQRGAKNFTSTSISVRRHGDIVEMAQIPGLAEDHPGETVRCEQVVDPKLGLLVPSASERPGAYRHPGQGTSVLVIGDSFSRIYQFAEPASLGQNVAATNSTSRGSRRLLPGSAGFISHLARELKQPVDAIVSDGGASTDVRRKLSINPEILENKKVVIWEFVERDIALGAAGWEDVPLPLRMDS